MTDAIEPRSNRLKKWLSAVALMTAAGAIMPVAHADESAAKALFKAMSDYLAAQSAISFDFDSNLEIVTTQEQKIGLASSGTLTLNRPDKVRMSRTGGFADVEVVFDGKKVTLLGKNDKVFVQEEVSGTIDDLVDDLRNKFHRPVPAADLLMSDVNKQIMPLVTDVKDLGSGVIRGVECDHLAIRTAEVDLQIWIAQGDRPYPCKYVVTSRLVADGPQYSVEIRNWKTGDEVAVDSFAFQNATNAEKVDLKDLKDKISDFPANFAMGDKQ